MSPDGPLGYDWIARLAGWVIVLVVAWVVLILAALAVYRAISQLIGLFS